MTDQGSDYRKRNIHNEPTETQPKLPPLPPDTPPNQAQPTQSQPPGHMALTQPGSMPLPPYPAPAPPGYSPEHTQRAQPVVPPPGYNAQQQGYGPQQGYNPPPPGYGPPRPAAPSRPGPPPPHSKAGRKGRAKGKPRRRKRRLNAAGCLMILGAALAVFLGLALVVILVVVSVYGARLDESLQRLENLAGRRTFQTTVIYDRNGSELYQVFQEGRRTNVTLAELPPYVAQAHIAIEDDSFYSNPGIDLGSIIRAALQNTEAGDIASGASTITQQVVRNVLFDPEYRFEVSLQRKIDEAILALVMTGRLSKDQILELYLNEIYYGNLSYGIEAAAQTIFGKSAAELTLGEAALLAGLPQAPSELDPLNPDPEIQDAVYRRQRLVLNRMVQVDFITQDQADEAFAAGLSFGNPDVELRAPHFTVYAQRELEALMASLGYSQDIFTTGGLRIYTTLDLRYNNLAERVASEQIAALRNSNDLSNAAVVVLQPVTGEILAMVGSVDYWDDSIDGRVNVTTAARQPGSTMKPFTYAAAMELGWSAANIIWDTETHIGIPGQEEYVPVNYDERYHGPVRVRDALANSYNIPAVQTLREVTVDYLLAFMQRMGVESLGNDASYYGLSLTLGGGEVTLLELTRAYTVFANGGLLVPSTTILCVTDSQGNIFYQYEEGCPQGSNTTEQTQNFRAYGQQALDERVAYVISDILADNAARTPAMGSNSPLYTSGIASSVKTGTTNDYRDNWTVGFTRNVAVGVWAGNTDNSPMRQGTSGLTGAAPIWNEVMTAIYNDPALLNVLQQNGAFLPDQIAPPPGISRRTVCELSSLQDPATGCPRTREEYFLDGPALLPTVDGQMIASTEPLAPALRAPDPAGNGPQPNEAERGLFQALVQPLPEPLAQAIQFNVQPGHPTPPAPRYCLVPNEVAAQVPGAQTLLFIGAPRETDDAVYATQWAYASGIPIMPLIPCTGEMLGAAQTAPSGGNTLPEVVTAYISSPAPGQEVRDNIPIIGTAAFGPGQVDYYKIEMRGPQFPQWVTLGNTHNQPVVDGQLEWLAAAGLQPGQYFLRLILIRPDSSYLQSPYEVSFIVP